jgi:hypothetical protein
MQPAARVLLHGADRRSGVFPYPALDRLVGFTDSSGRRKIKGNMDIELAVDVLEMAEHLDHIVLFSGDGDFRRLVEAVQRKGVRVTVVSTVRSQPSMVADELRRQSDIFIDIFDLQDEIARAQQHPHPRPRIHQAPYNEVHEDEDEEDVDDVDDEEDYEDEDDEDYYEPEPEPEPGRA